MNTNTPTVLLISDDAADAMLIRKALTELHDNEWRLEQVSRLSDGVNRLRKEGIAAVLLDLFLPDSQGIETFEALFEAAPLVPILVLANRENEDIAWQATQRGAQDHLLKDHLDAYWLPRIVRSVIERKAAEDALFIEKERAQVTLNSIGDAVLSTDIAGNVTYLNRSRGRHDGLVVPGGHRSSSCRRIPDRRRRYTRARAQSDGASCS